MLKCSKCCSAMALWWICTVLSSVMLPLGASVSVCVPEAYRSPGQWFGCLRRGQELLSCSAESLHRYCPSLCMPHGTNSRCVCTQMTYSFGIRRACNPVGLTSGWTGLRAEIMTDPCVPCNTLPMELPCHGFIRPSRCKRHYWRSLFWNSFSHQCTQWNGDHCASAAVKTNEGYTACPADRQGPHCGYQQLNYTFVTVSLYNVLRKQHQFTVTYTNEPLLISVEIKWDQWRHPEDWKTSDLQVFGFHSNSSVEKPVPPHRVFQTATTIVCQWNVVVRETGRQFFEAIIGYHPKDQQTSKQRPIIPNKFIFSIIFKQGRPPSPITSSHVTEPKDSCQPGGCYQTG